MSDKTLKKIILDIVMTVIFLILIDPKNTGMTFHEIVGLTMGALFTFHIFLNWAWVKSITRNLFNPKLKTKTKVLYILNAVSFISVITIIFTGIEISQVLFASESAGLNESFYTLHKWVSYFCLGLFAIHIVLHWRFIIDAMRKFLSALNAPTLGKAVTSMGAVLLMAGLLYSQIYTEPPSYRRESFQSETGEAQDSTITTDSGTAYEYPTEADNSTSVNPGSMTQVNQDSTITTDTGDTGDKVTLNDYLERMFCNGCHNHCSLLSLQCDRGYQQLENAKVQYQQEYGSTSVN
jgi:hypothetical protein